MKKRLLGYGILIVVTRIVDKIYAGLPNITVCDSVYVCMGFLYASYTRTYKGMYYNIILYGVKDSAYSQWCVFLTF